LQDFCGLWRLDGKVGLTSKSTLERCQRHFSAQQWELLHMKLTGVLSNEEDSCRCDLVSALSTAVAQMDSTCLEANIHFPTDWVLLKDVSLSLLLGVKRIRTSGIVCRMPESVEQLSRQMNVVYMQMSQLRRKADAARLRKDCLRQMKQLLQRIGGHARRHRDALRMRGLDHGWSQPRRDSLLERMDRYLGLLPKVIHQAHERIIGGRQVPRQQKILSIHDPDLQVIVRGKAIVNIVIPKNPRKLSEKLQDPCLAFWIHRRGRVEARISTVKNHASGRVCRAKGFLHRSQWVAATIVAHNLRWVVRKLLINKKTLAPPKAA
jgi:hypothetical protein